MTTLVRRFLAGETRATGLPLAPLSLIALAVFVAVAFVAVNPWHPDEHFQILEFAWARAGLAPLDGLPWEYAERIRPALQPTLALGVLALLRWLGITSPYAWTTLLHFGTLLLALTAMLIVVTRVGPTLTVRGRRVLWLTTLFFWVSPLFAFRFSSENASGIALVGALCLVRADDTARPRHDWWTGTLLGLAFVLRFQLLFAAVPVVLWIGMRAPDGWRRALRITAGALLVVGIGALIDSWYYQEWVFTQWRYFRVNVIEARAATYGVSPWYTYFVWMPLWLAPPVGVAVVLMCLGGLVSRPRDHWTWATAGFLAAHFAASHKEVRFLFPLLYVVPVLVARCWDAIERRRALTGPWRIPIAVLGAQNLLLLALLPTPAIHRGKELDWHYFRFLWEAAESRPERPVVVLDVEGNPYRADPLDVSVYRHPRVVGVKHAPGDSVPDEVRRSATAGDVFALTVAPDTALVAGAVGYDLVYEAEPGYRRMARWVGAEGHPFIAWLEQQDRWARSRWIRRVYRVRFAP